jgi:hypothetical protein
VLKKNNLLCNNVFQVTSSIEDNKMQHELKKVLNLLKRKEYNYHIFLSFIIFIMKFYKVELFT